ncbi:uncharacterized protein PAE49_005637 [Odontesthes bonariensis]|uniref:uncharacterized protein LOC142379686 n=1 Tax=Odontesthes bonariensis TaxID=219752 RepID=UPI003F582841
MNNSGHLTLNSSSNDNSTKKKEKAPSTQVVTFKASSMQRIIQVMQAVAQKSCIRACQLFCLPVDSQTSWCSAPTPQSREEKHTPETLKNAPSTILIVNISNSTLTNCVIGDSNPSAVTERQPLLRESEPQKQGTTRMRCSCSHGQHETAPTAPPSPASPYLPPPSGEHLNICIHSSSLNYVIIGDNNNMRAECDTLFGGIQA